VSKFYDSFNLYRDYILGTLDRDRTETEDEAILELYKKIKPGEALVLESAKETIWKLDVANPEVKYFTGVILVLYKDFEEKHFNNQK